jgi:hypothetical protein
MSFASTTALTSLGDRLVMLEILSAQSVSLEAFGEIEIGLCGPRQLRPTVSPTLQGLRHHLPADESSEVQAGAQVQDFRA